MKEIFKYSLIFALFILSSAKLYVNDGAFISYGTDSTVVTGKLRVTGQVEYAFAHAVAYTTSAGYTPDITINVPYRITPGMVASEIDYVTFAGDTFTCVITGDYLVTMYCNISGGNNDDFTITMRKNRLLTGISGFFQGSTSGAGNYTPCAYGWYVTNVVAGDDFSFYITNLTDSDDATIRGMKVIIYRMPES